MEKMTNKQNHFINNIIDRYIRMDDLFEYIDIYFNIYGLSVSLLN